MRCEKGFTLLELMIVVAIILIVAAIAIPCFTDSKINANEASAVASIRVISNAELQYQAAYGGFADSLANLGGADPCTKSPETGCLLDQSVAGGVKSGYNLSAVGSTPARGANTSFVVGAAPVAFNHTGKRVFCSTDKNVIRADQNPGGSTVPPNAAQCAGFAALQ